MARSNALLRKSTGTPRFSEQQECPLRGHERFMRERSATLIPTLSLGEGEGAVSIPSPPKGEGQGEGPLTTRRTRS